ncbi:MAG: hydrolase [Hyphomicrobiales bacterium]|nr:hydrolase [Hyphomicrobiales bacterium]
MSALLSRARAHLMVVDVQERLLPAMTAPDALVAQCARLIQGAARLGAPITVSEQYPKGIGATVESLRGLLPDGAATLSKMAFSCMGDAAIAERVRALAAAGRTEVLVCGIEAHVCVLQTAIALQEAGLRAFVAADAVSSRQPLSRDLALRRMELAGVGVVSVEMALFEWLGEAGTPDFKALAPLIK